MHKNNSRGRQKRAENRLDETVRVASIVQKGISTGRSSYVEMRALERIVQHNLRSQVYYLRQGDASKESKVSEMLSEVLAVHGGYTETLTPNGVLKKDELEHLISLDSEISVCLGMMESAYRSNEKTEDCLDALKEMLEERKKLVGSLKA